MVIAPFPIKPRVTYTVIYSRYSSKPSAISFLVFLASFEFHTPGVVPHPTENHYKLLKHEEVKQQQLLYLPYTTGFRERILLH
jgi:hypothetical protein